MSLPTKIGLAVLSLLVAAVVAALVIVPLVVDEDALRPQLEQRLSALLDRKVTLGTLRLSFWGGFGASTDGIRIDAPQGAEPGSAPTLEASRARIRLSFLALLRKRLVIRSLELDSGTLRLGEDVLLQEAELHASLARSADGGLATQGTLAGRLSILPGSPRCATSFAVSLVEDRLQVRALSGKLGPGSFEVTGELTGLRSSALAADLQLSARLDQTVARGSVQASLRAGEPEIAFDLSSPSLDLDALGALLRARSAAPATAASSWDLVPPAYGGTLPAPTAGGDWLGKAHGKGTLRAERARFAGLELGSLLARVEYADRTLRFPQADFELYGGRHSGTLEIGGHGPELPFRLRGRLLGVDVERLARAADPKRGGTLQGTADLALDLAGRVSAGAPDRASLAGTGRLEIRDGRLVSVGVLRQVARLLERAGGKGIGRDDTPFRSMSASFHVGDGVARTDDLAVRSADLDLDGKGSLGLDGALALDLSAAFSKEVSAALVRETPQLKLRVGPDGRLTVPLQMVGSVSAPQVRVDVDRVLSEGIGRILEEKGKKGLLKKLFGGR